MSLIGRIRWTAGAALLAASVALPPTALAASVPALGAPTRENARVHAHFDSVLTELAAAPVSMLGTTQLQHRRALLSTLRGYRDRTLFPRNYDFAAPTPYFVDRKTGVLCAVAHLLESTGRRDIVDRVAAANNNVWVAALASDTAFTAWLGAQGLTLSEAARIQVPYVGDGPAPVVMPSDSPNAVAIVAWAVGVPLSALSAVGTGLWNASGNRDGHSRFATGLGIVSGFTTMAVGGFIASNAPDGDGRAIGTVGAAIGATALGLSIRAVRSQGRILAAQKSERAGVRASVSPILPSRDSGAGLAVSMRF